MGRSDLLAYSGFFVEYSIVLACIVYQDLWTRAKMETIKRIFEVDRREINYLRVTIESYDGMGLVKTIDPHAALIEVRVSPGCELLFSELIHSLEQNEGISVLDKTGASYEV